MTADELVERLISFAARVGKVVIAQSIVTAKENKEKKLKPPTGSSVKRFEASATAR